MTMQHAVDSRAREIAELGPWFHNLHLPGGLQTAPDSPYGDFPAWKWRQIAPHIPDDLDGWRVLDIGCNAGFYSFKLAERGASVTAVDHDDHYLAQARWAARQLDPRGRVRFKHGDVYSLARSLCRYDLVLFLGVLYHLRYPLLALDTIARLEPRLMIVQTLTMPGDEIAELSREPFDFEDRARMNAPGWPLMAFIESAFADDETNWWAPNRACIHALLRNVGFRVVAEPAHEFFVCLGERPRKRNALRDRQWDEVMG